MAASDTRVMDESFRVAADGSYAARLRSRPGSGHWYAERWTLGGPEPYTVPLPVEQPEEPDSEVLPLADGQVLIARRVSGGQAGEGQGGEGQGEGQGESRFGFALLYPSGRETGERRLGTVAAERLTLLPPAPCGTRAYALETAGDERSATVWRVVGGAGGAPERVARVEGRCAGGAWLDRDGRLLALDRTEQPGGPVKTVAVDLARDGAVSPLLQITEESNDRLLLADPDSGLLVVRSDAPGSDRLGWGVLGSHRPVRFPDVLDPAATRLTPFAARPGQELLPERCGVALRVDAANGTWLAVWRPGLRELRHIAGPPGWLTGNGLWTPDGDLCVPYSTAHNPCGLARLRTPLPEETGQVPQPARPAGAPPGPVSGAHSGSASGPHSGPASEAHSGPASEPGPLPEPRDGGPRGVDPPTGGGLHGAGDVTGSQHHGHEGPSGAGVPFSAGGTGSFGVLGEPASKPVPLQQAPLTSGTA